MSAPSVIVLGGPNGSGKSTAAVRLLHDALTVMEFVNADDIARGLSPFNPEGVAVQAGRIMLDRIDELSQRGESFAFETTLASRSFAALIKRLQNEQGYRFRLVYTWLRSPELNVNRVALRVESGGHHVPRETIRRRYFRSVRNFMDLYLPLADEWSVHDNSRSDDIRLVAAAKSREVVEIFDKQAWAELRSMYDVAANE